MHLPRLAAIALALLTLSPARAQDAAPPAADAPPPSQPGDPGNAVARAPGDWVEIRLKAGPVFRGALAGEDARAVRIRSLAGAVRTIPRSSIAHVVPIEAPPAPPSRPAAPEAPASEPPAGGSPEATPAAPAAPATQEGDARMIGLGVNLQELDLAAGTTTLYVPIQLGESSRVELELGLASSLGGDDDLVARLGFGVFATRMAAEQLRTYVGGRASLSRVEILGSDSTALRFAAAVGAEWVPVRRVALGVEGQAILGFVTGDADDEAAFGTAALAFLRVFLW